MAVKAQPEHGAATPSHRKGGTYRQTPNAAGCVVPSGAPGALLTRRRLAHWAGRRPLPRACARRKARQRVGCVAGAHQVPTMHSERRATRGSRAPAIVNASGRAGRSLLAVRVGGGVHNALLLQLDDADNDFDSAIPGKVTWAEVSTGWCG